MCQAIVAQLLLIWSIIRRSHTKARMSRSRSRSRDRDSDLGGRRNVDREFVSSPPANGEKPGEEPEIHNLYLTGLAFEV